MDRLATFSLRSILPPGTDWDLLSSYAGLLGLACSSIYVGAYASLSGTKKKPKKDKGKENKKEDDDEAEDEDEDEEIEMVSLEDAWWFPIIGSVVLFGLFLVMKYFGKVFINWLLGWYFSITGIGSIFRSALALARYLFGRERWEQFERIQIKLTKSKGLKRSVDGEEKEKVGQGSSDSRQVKKQEETLLWLSWRTPSTLILGLSTIPSILYRFSATGRRSILLTDILAMSFSHNALSLIKLDSFATGCALLSGLFFYDIWWVFGTRVMVEVATGLDVPIKLLWPKSLEFTGGRGFTMLGLGDIVIPGTFIALALRYDLRDGQKGKTPWFFYSTLMAYFIGLVTTMTVMHVWGHAQPALLYLSPGCILGFLLPALVRGEFAEAWRWTSN